MRIPYSLQKSNLIYTISFYSPLNTNNNYKYTQIRKNILFNWVHRLISKANALNNSVI